MSCPKEGASGEWMILARADARVCPRYAPHRHSTRIRNHVEQSKSDVLEGCVTKGVLCLEQQACWKSCPALGKASSEP